MSFKIGFTAQTEPPKMPTSSIPRSATTVPKKSLVEVFFPDRNLTCSYYNDTFDLAKGDLVYVEGKLEGLRGRVTKVSYTFKIKLSDYKRVIALVDTNVSGEFFMAGSHFFTFDREALPYEQAIRWLKAPENEEEEFVSAWGVDSFPLDDHAMNIYPEKAHKGYEYYTEGRVVYIELKDGRGRAIVEGGSVYEVEFYFRDGIVSSPVCSCYCTDFCKHEFAVMLQLKETLEILDREYGDAFEFDYISIVSMPLLFRYGVDGKTRGSVIIE